MMHARTQGILTQLEWLFGLVEGELSRLQSYAQRLPNHDDRLRIGSALDGLAIACETTSIAAADFEAAVCGVLAVIVRPGANIDDVEGAIAESLGQMYVDDEMARALRVEA